MKFTLRAASDWAYEDIKEKYGEELKNFNIKFNGKRYEIIINDIETLSRLIEEVGEIVVQKDSEKSNKYKLLIYDDFIEN